MNDDAPASGRLRAAAGSQATLGTIADALGTDAPGMLVLVLATFALVPGAAPVFATGILVVATSLLLGRDRLALPERLRGRPIAPRTLDRAARRLAAFERRVGAGTGRARVPVRLVTLLLIWDAILVILPIPLGNGPPAIAAVLLALGVVDRNGRALVAGTVATLLATLFEAALLWLGIDLVRWLIRLF